MVNSQKMKTTNKKTLPSGRAWQFQNNEPLALPELSRWNNNAAGNGEDQ